MVLLGFAILVHWVVTSELEIQVLTYYPMYVNIKMSKGDTNMDITLRDYLKMHKGARPYDHLSIMKDGQEVGSMCGAFVNGAEGYVDDIVMDMNILNLWVNTDGLDFGDDEVYDELIIEVDGSNLMKFQDLPWGERYFLLDNMRHFSAEFAHMTLDEIWKYLDRHDIMIYYGDGVETLFPVLVEY